MLDTLELTLERIFWNVVVLRIIPIIAAIIAEIKSANWLEPDKDSSPKTATLYASKIIKTN